MENNNSPISVSVYGEGVLHERLPFTIEATTEGIIDVAQMMNSGVEISLEGTQVKNFSLQSEIDEMLVSSSVARQNLQDPQVVSNLVLETMHNHRLQKVSESLGYLLIGKDLTGLDKNKRLLNFVFGSTAPAIGKSIQSIYRFLQAGTTAHELFQVTRHIARHEFGHLIGLSKETIKNPDTRKGIYSGHCANVCTMRQVSNVGEANKLSGLLSDMPCAGFCIDCINYIEQQ